MNGSTLELINALSNAIAELTNTAIDALLPEQTEVAQRLTQQNIAAQSLLITLEQREKGIEDQVREEAIYLAKLLRPVLGERYTALNGACLERTFHTAQALTKVDVAVRMNGQQENFGITIRTDSKAIANDILLAVRQLHPDEIEKQEQPEEPCVPPSATQARNLQTSRYRILRTP